MPAISLKLSRHNFLVACRDVVQVTVRVISVWATYPPLLITQGITLFEVFQLGVRGRGNDGCVIAGVRCSSTCPAYYLRPVVIREWANVGIKTAADTDVGSSRSSRSSRSSSSSSSGSDNGVDCGEDCGTGHNSCFQGNVVCSSVQMIQRGCLFLFTSL